MAIFLLPFSYSEVRFNFCLSFHSEKYASALHRENVVSRRPRRRADKTISFSPFDENPICTSAGTYRSSRPNGSRQRSEAGCQPAKLKLDQQRGRKLGRTTIPSPAPD
jgi:hypothetical protein